MIQAEKVRVKGQDWIKVQFPPHPVLTKEMHKVEGARYNSSSRLWSVPYKYRRHFERIMGNHLIIWKGDSGTGGGGIPEELIPSQPLAPGYGVTYDEKGNVVDSFGFKTSPWGEFQVKGFNAIYQSDFLILADEAGLGNGQIIRVR